MTLEEMIKFLIANGYGKEIATYRSDKAISIRRAEKDFSRALADAEMLFTQDITYLMKKAKQESEES